MAIFNLLALKREVFMKKIITLLAVLISLTFSLEISYGRSFSNTDDFNVTSSSNTIKINIEIEKNLRI